MVKHVLDQLRDYNPRVSCIYVNCWYHSTSMAIYTKIAEALGEPVSRRGRATDEIFDRIIELMKYSKTPVMLVLYEIDGLLCSDDVRILHNITRSPHLEAVFGIVGISNDRNIFARIHPRMRDHLTFTNFEVQGYNRDELFELLKLRAEAGLFSESYDFDALKKIADFALEHNGNGRLALELLCKTAKQTQLDGKTRFSTAEVEEMIRSIESSTPFFGQEERLIIEILSGGQKTSSEFYWRFQKTMWISKRQIRNYLAALECKGVIETRLIQKGNQPGFKIIKLKDGGV